MCCRTAWPPSLARPEPRPAAWLGDAELRAMAPGEARIIAFARDRDVLLSATQSSTEQPVTITLQRGVVLIGTTAAGGDRPGGGPARRARPAGIGPAAPPRPAPQFPVLAEGDFGLRTEADAGRRTTTLRFGWSARGGRRCRYGTPGWATRCGCAGATSTWRRACTAARRAGQPGTLRSVLERTRRPRRRAAALADIVAALAEARRLLDAARGAIRTYAVTDAMRAPAPRRGPHGPAREAARKQLTRRARPPSAPAPRRMPPGRPGSARCRLCSRARADGGAAAAAEKFI